MLASRIRSAPLAALATVLVLVVAAASALPAGAVEGPSGPDGADTRIIGGSEAPPGAWPSQAGVLRRDQPDDYQAQICGATTIAASWVLTAAHCTMDDRGSVASSYDVLTGRSDLSTAGGQRLPVVEIKRHPGWDPESFRNDVALFRLDQPTTAPAMPLVQPGQESLWAPGVTAEVTGWGDTDPGPGGSYPTRLRQADVPMVSDADCADSYPLAPDRFYADSMVCAGVLGTGGRDTCQGDSGGPLVVARPGGGWLQAGITSWGIGCAESNHPGVYARVATFSPWIAAQIRFGPFGRADDFLTRQYLDIFGRAPTATERTAALDRLAYGSTPEAEIAALVRNDTSFRSVGAIVRFYGGFFGRDPDTSGLLYWIGQYRAGVPLSSIASTFSRSREFQGRYGPLTDSAFVDLVYDNVLHRAPDPDGKAYWMDRLAAGVGRGSVMANFTESAEHRSRTRTRVERVIASIDLVRVAPTRAWLDANLAVPLPTVIATLFTSVGYARRF